MSSAGPPLLTEQYVAALEDYLRGSGETALSRAYDLGRDGLSAGMGVLDMAMIHRDAVGAVLRGSLAPHEFARAAEFFAESLAPFEMSFRGYIEANERLQTLNRTLAAQNVELRSATSRADAANQELESFSYSVAHDLRAPLRHIDSFSAILQRELTHALDQRGQDYLQRIRAATKRMGELIDDLLQLSRVTRADFHRAAVDLTMIARGVAAELEQASPLRAVQWKVQDGLTADGDARLLRVMLENLLGNAWKFTGQTEQPLVEVGRVMTEDRPTFYVRDNGAGFDPRYADRLFLPFQRLHRESEFPGTGVGLATVQRIIRRHGGDIWSASAPGQGATFFWTLP
jgi:light-regulated signal transduction histidine kinase (bacteriophytochrome)